MYIVSLSTFQKSAKIREVTTSLRDTVRNSQSIVNEENV